MRIALIVFCLLMGNYVHAVEVRTAESKHVTGWFIQDTTLPIVHASIRFNGAGAISDSVSKAGRASLASQLLREGAGSLDARAFNEKLDYYAIDLDVSAGRDDLVITVSTLKEHADKAFELVGIMLDDPHMDEEDITRIRTEHIAGIKTLQQRPHYIAAQSFAQHAFGEHPYANPVYGTVESITELTRDDLHAYVEEYISSYNAEFSASGDVTAEDISRYMSLLFDALPVRMRNTLIDEVIIATPDDPLIVKKSFPQTIVSMGTNGIARNDKDFYAAYVMNHMLGGSGLTSQLSDVLRHQHGLTYSVSSGLSTNDYSQWLSINFATKGESADKAVALTMDTLRDVASSGFSEEQLALAKDNITGEFPLNIDSNAERTVYLSIMQKYGLGTDYLDKRNHYMRNVTMDDIKRVTSRLIQPNNFLTILVGDPS